MWHVSVSVWTPDRARRRNAPGLAELEAVKLLRSVGGDREWWWHNPATLISHLRVGLTVAEFADLPGGCAIADAGESGPERARTR